MKNKLKPVTETGVIIYARPGGWHYHLDRECSMLQGGDFGKLNYKEIKARDITKRHLNPCLCCYQDSVRR